MLKWEYTTIHLSDLPRQIEEVDLLNEAGDEGWELVGLTTNNVAYLKRHVAGTAPRSAIAATRRKASNANK